MISMYTISSAAEAANYHDKSFNNDGISRADNYYVDEQSKAIWKGNGAELLGMEGKEVTKEDFISMLEGKLKNPKTGELQDLSNNERGDKRRLGYDFTVSPPKSVSVVGLVGGDERIIKAHVDANERAMTWLEKNASVVRVVDNNGGREAQQKGNLLYASVLHETNRNNEPQIHSHNVIVSAVYDKESSKWRSLTNDQLLVLRQSADNVYKSELALNLKKAGYKLDYDKNGVDFEIAGLSRGQIEAYSTRSSEIKKTLLERGIDPSEANVHQRQIATLDTRTAKNEKPREILQSVWQDIAASENINLKGIVNKSIENKESPELQSQLSNKTLDRVAITSVDWAIAHLSEREQAFTRTDLEVAALKFDKNSIDKVEAVINEKVKNGYLIDKGLSEKGADILTTKKALESEKEFIGHIKQGIGVGNTVLSNEKEFLNALSAFEKRKSAELGIDYKLSGEQVNSARNVLMHADTYQGIQGDAGTGKTAALELVKEVAENKGWSVVGMATTSSAAKELEASSGIQSKTVAGFIHDKENSMKLAKLELDELVNKLQKTQKEQLGTNVGVKTLILEDGVTGKNTKYTFNSERDSVYKTPDNLRNKLGDFLLNLGNKDTVSKDKNEITMLDRLKEQGVLAGTVIAENLGKKIVSYEKVGVAEAIDAKQALLIKERDEITNIKFQIGVKGGEIKNLESTGNKEGRKVLMVMDETTMTGVEDSLKISRVAKEVGARVIFQGDIKQHGSVAAGRAFGQAINGGLNKSVLEETRRFDNATESTQDAVRLFSKGKMSEALGRLDRFDVKDEVLPNKVAERYLANLEELKAKGVSNPTIGIVTVTNEDRKNINNAVHNILVSNGHVTGETKNKEHLDILKLTEAERLNVRILEASKADSLIFTKSYKEVGIKKDDLIKVVGFDVEKNLLTVVNSKGEKININPKSKDYFTAMKMEIRQYGVGDKVEARAPINFKEKNVSKIDNGSRGVISAIDKNGATVRWEKISPNKNMREFREIKLNNEQLRMVDLSYGRTTFKEQGATNEREIIAVSAKGANVFNKEAAYVAGTRAKGNTEIVTSDFERMQKSSETSVEKTTAIDIGKNKIQTKTQINSNVITKENDKSLDKNKSIERTRANQNLGFTVLLK